MKNLRYLLKLITLGRIDLDKIDRMELDEMDVYVEGEKVALLIKWTYLFNYVSVWNYWQYILVMYMV